MNPRTRTIYQETNGSRWDVRAWRIGLIGGVLSGLGIVFGAGIGVYKGISGHAPALALGLMVASTAAVFLVLPGVLSGIARRRWLLWAYLPMLVSFFSIVIAAIVDVAREGSAAGGGSTSWSRSDTQVMIGVLLTPLAVSGVVCLIRLWRIAVIARRQARLAYEASQFTIERTGVWPPPVITPAENPDADLPGHNYR